MSEPLLYWATAVAAVGLSVLAVMLIVVAWRGVGSGRSSRQARTSIRAVRTRGAMARRVTGRSPPAARPTRVHSALTTVVSTQTASVRS